MVFVPLNIICCLMVWKVRFNLYFSPYKLQSDIILHNIYEILSTYISYIPLFENLYRNGDLYSLSNKASTSSPVQLIQYSSGV